jgi:putative membrane protein
MRLVFKFLLRWIVNAFGLWLAVRLFGTGYSTADFTAESSVFLVAGLILSVINILLRPIVVLISLPVTIVTLGLFMLVVNGLMVYFALRLSPDISITFGHAIIAGVIIGLVNYVMSGIMKAQKR